MALTNAEKQARFRAKRDREIMELRAELVNAPKGKPQGSAALRELYEDGKAQNAKLQREVKRQGTKIQKLESAIFSLEFTNREIVDSSVTCTDLAEILRESPNMPKAGLINRALGLVRAATRKGNWDDFTHKAAQEPMA